MDNEFKNYKKYSKSMLVSFFSIIVFFVLFNIAVDPFKIFNFPLIKHFNVEKPDLKRQQRVTKIIELKLDKRPLYSIFLGSSRVDGSILEEDYLSLFGKRTKNLGMNALSHSETIKIADNVILIHPEIKKIYVGLDFFRFLEKTAQNKRAVPLSNNPKLTISEFNPVVLSIDTIVSSFNTVASNLIRKKDSTGKYNPMPNFERTLNNYTENYYKPKLVYGEFERLSKFQKEMGKKGYDVIFYTNPTHASDLSLIKQSGSFDIFKEWKKELAQRFDYIDFDFVNDATGEKVDENTKYFGESSHCTPLMGKIILNNIIKPDNKYGININYKNVEKYNRMNEKALTKWEKENPELVKKINLYIIENKKESEKEKGN